MKATRVLVATLLISIFLLGCAQEGKPSIGKPEIRGISHEWGKVTSSTTEIYGAPLTRNPISIQTTL